MAWTYEQRMDRASKALLDRNTLDETQIQVVKRPLYFDRYKFSIGLSLCLPFWGEILKIRDEIQSHFNGLDVLIQCNRKTRQWFLFSSDPAVIRRTMKLSMFDINHLRMVDSKCWLWKLPPPTPKGKFYGEFGWRFEFRDPKWGSSAENMEQLEGLSGAYKLVQRPKTFLYLSSLNDVLLFKLVASEQLLSLDERT